MRRIKERCFVALLQSQTITVDKGLGIRLKVNAHDKIQLMGFFFFVDFKADPNCCIPISLLVQRVKSMYSLCEENGNTFERVSKEHARTGTY